MRCIKVSRILGAVCFGLIPVFIGGCGSFLPSDNDTETAEPVTVQSREQEQSGGVRVKPPHPDYLPPFAERAEQAPVTGLRQLPEQLVYHELRLFASYVHERIAAGDYDTWKELLTDSYREYYGDEQFLSTLSQRAVLRNQGITLETLRDYFDHVVVESRTDTDVDAVEVLDSDQALAYTEIDGETVVLMLAVIEDGHWKIERY